MVSATSIGKLKIQDRGDSDWDTETEANLNRLEEMIASEVAISTTGGDTVLTTTEYIANQSRRPILRVSGTLSSNSVIQVPAPSSAMRYLVLNGTTGAYTVTVRIGAAGETVAIPQGYMQQVLVNATDAWAAGPPISLSTGRMYADGAVLRNDAVSRAFVEDRVTIILDKDLSAPPGGESAGDTYYVAGTGSGAWAGHDGEIARYDGASWIFSTLPAEGLLAWVVDEGKIYASDSSALVDIVGAGGVADGSITAAKLASDAVETAKILDANVTEAKLAANSVALSKLKSDVYATTSEAKTGTSTTKIPAVADVKHAAFPAGTVMIFRQSNAPTGWTKVTSGVDNSTLRVVSDVLVDGGSLDFTSAFSSSRTPTGTVGNTTLSESQIPSHRHFVGNSNASGSFPPNTSEALAMSANFGNNFSYSMARYAADADVGLSSATGGGSSHTHSLSMNTLPMDVKFLDVIAATKDSP